MPNRPALFLIAVISLAFASCPPPAQYTTQPLPPTQSIAREVEIVNLAAYPEGAYTVQAGDTPRSIAQKLRVDYDALVSANDLKPETILHPGDVLVVPRVAPRNGDLPALAARAAPPAPRPAPVPETAAVDRDGTLRALSAGVVSDVKRGYPGLGDVVIIETGADTLVYSGDFTPAVEKGDAVAAGSAVGRSARASSVKVTRAPK